MRVLLLTLLCAAACGAQPAPPTPAPQGSAPGTTLEREAFRLLNDARVAHGCPALAWSDTAAAVAEAHAADMVARNFFSHNNPDGVSPGRRLMLAGIGWRRVGENIADTPGGSAADVARQWLGSPAHRTNVLTCEFTETGIGESRGKWVQVFFARS